MRRYSRAFVSSVSQQRFVPLALVLVTIFAGLACGGMSEDEEPLATPTPAKGDTTLYIYDGEHKSINIIAGSRIRWRNLGEIAHTVTARDGSFDTREIEEGQTSGYILFPKPGVVKYYDALNPSMEAVITVLPRK